MKIRLTIPNNFLPERKYSLGVLFSYFQDVELIFDVHDEEHTKFAINSQTFLIITDAFWNEINEEVLDYKMLKVPEKVSSMNFENTFFSGELLTIYGENTYSIENHTLHLKADLIASTFFMLSRWEEYTSIKRDTFGRFEGQESLLHKTGNCWRPIVNEYIFFLKVLIENQVQHKIKLNRKYQAHITHDVDELYRLRPFSKFCKALGGDLITRKSIPEFFRTIKTKVQLELGQAKDPSDTFDYLMDVSEKHGLTSRFYFIPGEKGEKDYRYSISGKKALKLIKHVEKRNHIVGIHPSLEATNQEAFSREYGRLKKVTKQKIRGGRQHYLNFSVPYTWRYYEAHGLTYDSTLGHRTCAGFRCGMCYSHPVFDFLERTQLNLLELPLVFMEVALTQNNCSPDHLVQTTKKLSDIVKHYEGDFVLLWHNNNLKHPHFRKYEACYEKIVSLVAEKHSK